MGAAAAPNHVRQRRGQRSQPAAKPARTGRWHACGRAWRQRLRGRPGRGETVPGRFGIATGPVSTRAVIRKGEISVVTRESTLSIDAMLGPRRSRERGHLERPEGRPGARLVLRVPEPARRGDDRLARSAGRAPIEGRGRHRPGHRRDRRDRRRAGPASALPRRRTTSTTIRVESETPPGPSSSPSRHSRSTSGTTPRCRRSRCVCAPPPLPHRRLQRRTAVSSPGSRTAGAC
jgi:hypothetical protein